MRFSIFIIFIHTSCLIFGQKIQFKNDSLFINNYFVNWSTSKSTLDSLLLAKGKEKKGIGKYSPEKKRMTWTSITYNNEGLIFTKHDNDSSHLSVGLKLHRNTDPLIDQNNMNTKTFKGIFFIDENYMNDKRRIDQLQQLIYCSVSFKESNFSAHTGIIDCIIFYKKRSIKALFDFQTNELTCIFIN